VNLPKNSKYTKTMEHMPLLYNQATLVSVLLKTEQTMVLKLLPVQVKHQAVGSLWTNVLKEFGPIRVMFLKLTQRNMELT